ncbi:MAG: T9SS type A sorting domain-containing protein [Bacteroidota bacterium]
MVKNSKRHCAFPALAQAAEHIFMMQSISPGAAGEIYYQLKQTDFDGKTSFSEIRKVTLKSVPFNVMIYPNPADGSEFTTEVPIENTFVAMQVLNAAGQVVFSGTAQGPGEQMERRRSSRRHLFR